MEPLNEANGYSSKNAFKGRLIFGLYGKACPKVSQIDFTALNRTDARITHAVGSPCGQLLDSFRLFLGDAHGTLSFLYQARYFCGHSV